MNALTMVEMVRIKKGNGTGKLEMALTTLNSHKLSLSEYSARQEIHLRSEHNAQSARCEQLFVMQTPLVMLYSSGH
jgi:hypothetical protein